MRVLFVSSGNNNGISSIVSNQGESLNKQGLALDYYTIVGKGLLGYLKNIPKLAKMLHLNEYELIHVHYSLSAFLVTLSLPKTPVIVSLMGSDSKMSFLWRALIRFCARFYWKAVIVKSQDMKERLGLNKAIVIPNGVDLNKFKVTNKQFAKTQVNFDKDKKNILFLSDPSRQEKNFKLAENAVQLLSDNSILLHVIFNKPHVEVLNYLYASDILLLTSLWEGSPNVIKEAMACNLPTVSTDVGDVRLLIKGVDGCYLTSFDEKDVADKIQSALKFAEEHECTVGRDRIKALALDSESIAKKIIHVYNQVLAESL